MMIETTLMKFGSSPAGGLVGITLKPKSVARWAYSFHKLSQMIKDIKELHDTSTSKGRHKEEEKGRMMTDLADRKKIRQKLSVCIGPFHETDGEFAKTIVNIASGKVTPEAQTNIYGCLQISNAQYAEFEASLPQGFHDPIPKNVILAGTKTKQIKSADGKREAQDLGAIFNRLLLFNQVSDVEIDMKTVLGFELTPLPLSMFEPDGKMRLCKNKSDLKNTLKKEIPSRTAKAPDFVIIDGCAILWIIHWPTSGTLSSYIKGFLKYVLDKVSQNDTALIFDRYNEYSIKSVIREARNVSQSVKRVKLSLDGPIHPKSIVLGNRENKKHLIQILVHALKSARIPRANGKLIVTGEDSIPFEINNSGLIPREDLKTLHEEADTMIVSQMLSMISEGYKQISVICDDTDVFLILLHHFHRYRLILQLPPVDVLMNPTSSSTKSISIRKTVESLREDVISNLLAAHALSGCDTVPQMFSIGKKKLITVLMSGSRNGTLLKCLGDLDSDLSWEAIEHQCEKFVWLLYAQNKETTSLAEIRYKKWQDKAKANTMLSVLSLKALPPTMEALKLNIKRAHYQAAIYGRMFGR